MTQGLIKLTGSDLASRQVAANYRAELLRLVANNGITEIDLSDVISVSYSFADELFGVLAATHGWVWFTNFVRLRGANEHVLRVIAEVVLRRLRETDHPTAKRA